MKSKKDYISMLNDLGNSLSREEWIIGGKDRYTGRDNYGVMLKRYDPIAFEVGAGLMAVDPAAVESGTIWSPYTRELYDDYQIFSLV